MTEITAHRQPCPRRDRPGLRVHDDGDAGPEPLVATKRFIEPILGEEPTEPLAPLTEQEIVEIEARRRASQEHWERVHQALRFDAQSCVRSMRSSPVLGTSETWTETVGRSLDDYRSGRSLMDHMGADRLIDTALTGMLLAIRRGLVEEIHSASMVDFVLIDMTVIAFANAMRLQSIIGNTALIVESELFGQPTLRPNGRSSTEPGRRILQVWRSTSMSCGFASRSCR